MSSQVFDKTGKILEQIECTEKNVQTVGPGAPDNRFAKRALLFRMKELQDGHTGLEDWSAGAAFLLG
jgi:hypothetical protein